MFFTVIIHMKNGVIMSFKNKLFKEMLKMSSAASQKASNFLVLLLQWKPTQPTKNWKISTQPMGQPNPWTTLSGKAALAQCRQWHVYSRRSAHFHEYNEPRLYIARNQWLKWKTWGEGTPFSAWSPSPKDRAHQMMMRMNIRCHICLFYVLSSKSVLMFY